MITSTDIRTALAQVALGLTPPLIRESLLDNVHFREEFGFKRDSLIVFNDSGPSIQRSELIDAVRQAFSGESEQKVIDTNGKDWHLTIVQEKNQPTTLTITNNELRFSLLPYVTLSPSREVRLKSVKKIASDFNLPANTRDEWCSIVSNRALSDEEIDEFFNDFCDTPIHYSRSIHDEFSNGKISVSSLVPRSRRYYDRLVGVYDGCGSIGEYAAGPGKQFFEQLSSWQPYEGFLYGLLLSSHPTLTARVSVEHLGGEELALAFEHLEKSGDRISQLGAIEVGLRVLPDRPDIQPPLVRLIKQIRNDDPEASGSGFRLLSALFLLVDGELSRSRLLSEQPPFYRRLAALSQTALICRQFESADNAIDSFSEWAAKSRGGRHYLQSLADMRLEPRWYPNYSEASQIKANFYGRIVIAASSCEENIRGDELYDLILGEELGSIHSFSEVPRAYLPGPLEGAESSSYIMPKELSEAIKAQLSVKSVGLSSFTALLNFAPMFHVDLDKEELAARVRDLGSVLFAKVSDRSQLLYVLFGLASVAAVTRNPYLADELLNLARKSRQDPHYRFSVEEVLGIVLVASASRENLNDWIEFVGSFLTELAFSELKNDDWEVLYTHLQFLCHAVPELWASCSRADAALKSLGGYLGSAHIVDRA